MTDQKKTAPDALRTDRLPAVQYAMLTMINTYEHKERLQKEASRKPDSVLQPPADRDEPLHWERVHLASSARIAKDMAVQRGVDPELAAIACALHDIGRIVTGKQADHAHQGKEPARRLLEGLGLFTEEEICVITQAVYNHTDKDVIGTPLEEIVKDADVVDCYEVGMELPRPEQRARYQRYLTDSFGDLVEEPASVSVEQDSSTETNGLSRVLTLLKILGADGAKVIDPKQVITAPWVRFKCQYGCSLYGKNRCCPPYTPDHAETRRILDCYRTAILFHRRSEGDISSMAHKAMRQLFLDGYYKAAAFGSGACRLCEEETRGGSVDFCHVENCHHPEQATPSMEACGIDVLGTAKNCGFEIARTSDGEEFVNFFGLVLVE